jgi:hypothetical protein
MFRCDPSLSLGWIVLRELTRFCFWLAQNGKALSFGRRD